MIVETTVPFEELEEIRRKSGTDVRLVLLEGPAKEVERFMEKLRLARAGG